VTKATFFDFDGVLTTDAKGSLTMIRNPRKEVSDLSMQDALDCCRHTCVLQKMQLQRPVCRNTTGEDLRSTRIIFAAVKKRFNFF
jgi:hypothetical protein